MHKLHNLYLKLPYAAQKLVLQYEGWRIQRRRYDSSFNAIDAEVLAAHSLSGPTLHAFQTQQLSKTLQHAARLPFWKKRLEEAGLQWSPSKDPWDILNKLPVLQKEEARALARSLQKQGGWIKAHTSGTTGSGLQFYYTQGMEQRMWATWWRYRRALGLSLHQPMAYWGGRLILPLSRSRPPFWHYNRASKQWMMSLHHLRAQTVGHYADLIEAQSLEWMHGYPSTLSYFAQLVDRHLHRTMDDIRWITLGAENVLEPQKQVLQKVFPNARIAQHYGQAEGVANISECPLGHLHIDEDFSYVECLHDVSTGNFRLIGTSFWNEAFPLLRYNTGDLIELEKPPGAPCPHHPGRRVHRLDGRQEDAVVLPDGTRIGRLDALFKDRVHVQEAQLYQSDRRTLIIRIVRGSGYNSEEEERLKKDFRQSLGESLRIIIEYVDAIPRTASGKIRFVISAPKLSQNEEA